MPATVLTVVTLVLAVAALVVAIGWIRRRQLHWAVRHTRYGDVDQRWLIPIALFVDAIYIVVGVGNRAGSGFWISEAALVGVQAALIASWLGVLFMRSAGRRS